MKKAILPKINLRAMEPEDLDALYRIENDKKLWNVGVTNVPYSRYTLHNYIAGTVGDIYTDKQMRLIVESAEGKVAGVVDITEFDPRHLRAELGIVVKTEYRRQGYATAAVEEVLRYCREIIHLNQLYVIVDSENEASIRFFEKMGFSSGIMLQNWLYGGGRYHDAVLKQHFF